ncbi:MAG: cupin domain-containing protein [Acidobacteriota bacterium]
MRRALATALALGALLPGGASATVSGAVFELEELRHRLAGTEGPWLEFFANANLRTGLYRLPAGSEDLQNPHAEDEIYFVLRGKAVISIAGEDRPVGSGAVIFVAAEVEHRFHSITEDLDVLVFFAR